MKRLFARILLVIIDAGVEVLAERVRKRILRQGNPHGVDRDDFGGPTDDLSVQSAGSGRPNHPWRYVRRVCQHGRSKSEER
jgi:hypothetical protein